MIKIVFSFFRESFSHLFERVVEFTQDVVLVKDFALVAMFVVVVNFLSHVCRELVEGHVLLHLFVLGRQRKAKGEQFSEESLHQYVKHQILFT